MEQNDLITSFIDPEHTLSALQLYLCMQSRYRIDCGHILYNTEKLIWSDRSHVKCICR